MKRLRVFIPYLAIFAAIALPIAISAQMGPPPPGVPPPPPDGVERPPMLRTPGIGADIVMPPLPIQEIQRIGDELGLTEQKRQAIVVLTQERIEAMQAVMEQQPPLQRELQEIMMTSSPDAVKAKEIAGQIHQLRNKVAEIGIDYWVAVRSELTAAQNEKLTEILQQRSQRRFVPREPGTGRTGEPGQWPGRIRQLPPDPGS